MRQFGADGKWIANTLKKEFVAQGVWTVEKNLIVFREHWLATNTMGFREESSIAEISKDHYIRIRFANVGNQRIEGVRLNK